MNLAIEQPKDFIATKFLTQGRGLVCPWLGEASPLQRLHIRSTLIKDGVLLESRWQDLEARSPCSFFLSWSWIGTWIHTHPRKRNLMLLEVYSGMRLVGLAIVSRKHKRISGLMPSRTLYLHESGFPDLDTICIEGNGILSAPGFEQANAAALARCIDSQTGRCDELYFAGVSPTFMATLEQSHGADWELQIDKIDSSPYVDLTGIRNPSEYLSTRSSNVRSQIRRSVRDLETEAPLRIEVAQNTEEALSFLNELSRLHQARWQSRGKPGAFSMQSFRQFHTNLIRRAFPLGDIHLLRIIHGKNTLGVLYNFAYKNRIYAYQSGFDYSKPERRPGIVSHYLAICHYLGKFDQYDFLAGDSRYKLGLATDAYQLSWGRLRRKRLWLSIEKCLRWMKSRT